MEIIECIDGASRRECAEGLRAKESAAARGSVEAPAIYAPRPLQAELQAVKARFKVVVAHRRFGRTAFAVGEPLSAALANRRLAARYAYVAPIYRQAKPWYGIT